MKLAIISDIHSNLEALLAVLEEIRRREISSIVCLGDVVGYGANPNECCSLIKRVCGTTVLGNHDAVVSGLTRLKNFNDVAAIACQWTMQVITKGNREWLQKLPITAEIDGQLLVHSAPSSPEKWSYILSLGDAINEFHSFSTQVCLVGHSHIAGGFIEHEGRYNIAENPVVEIKPGTKYIINPGSVGQPRDCDPRAAFAIYDREKREVEIVRVPYDIRTAQQKILDAGLPEFLASRLAVGR